jgi:hypothetical protein
MAMMAMTTSSSISVKAARGGVVRRRAAVELETIGFLSCPVFVTDS